MTREIELSDRKLENFCVNYLRRKGYAVQKVFEYTEDFSESSILRRFYYLNSENNQGSTGSFINGKKIDSTVFKKLVGRLKETGLSYEHSLQYISELIEYLFENPVRFGGPFLSFRIFSSEDFVDNLSFSFEKERELRENKEWEKFTSVFSMSVNVDMKSVVENLTSLKEALKDG
jgi:hypothetical protein